MLTRFLNSGLKGKVIEARPSRSRMRSERMGELPRSVTKAAKASGFWPLRVAPWSQFA